MQLRVFFGCIPPSIKTWELPAQEVPKQEIGDRRQDSRRVVTMVLVLVLSRVKRDARCEMRDEVDALTPPPRDHVR